MLGDQLVIKSRLTLALAATLLATACNNSTTREPKGQVVANVGGSEITIADVRAEIGDLGPIPAERRGMVERAAMQGVIARQILANYVHEKGLDKTPAAAVLKRRSEQNALIELLTRDLREKAPKPTREEAQQFVADHPASFAQRRVFVVDQFIVRNPPEAVVKAMEPLNTMDEIAALLDKNKVSYSKAVGTLDALTIDSGAAEKIAALAPNAVFITPDAGVVRVNRIRESSVQPVTGDDAIAVAQEALRNRRTAELVNGQLKQIVEAGMSKVKLNPAFTPKPAKKQGAAPKP